MKTFSIALLFLIASVAAYCQGKESINNDLPVKWEELTAPDFIKAVEKSGATCVIPLGIMEKHGPHLPLGTDLIDVREISIRAAKKEYIIIFPPFYFGQIYEAKQQPGTVAYSTELVWNLLQETCDELYRNGITKIILVNGHGGNNSLLPYFCQAQLAKQKKYAIFLFSPKDSKEFQEKIKQMKKTEVDGHAGEAETSMMLSHRPDLVHLGRAKEQSGSNLNRIQHLPYTYTGIWWYAQYPNHYAGDGSYATKELGNLLLENQVNQLIEMIRKIKTDSTVLELQNEFYEQSKQPLKTKQ